MDRRQLFRISAAAALSASLPEVRAAAPGPVMAALSDYMASAAGRALPAEVSEQAKHHLLDTIASMVSGSELPPGQAGLRHVRANGGKGTATIAASSLTASPADAALANGMMAHADETDDSHNASRSHPGCAVVPAALATAEQLGCGGAQLLRAVALGYDIGPRVGGPAARARAWCGGALSPPTSAGGWCGGGGGRRSSTPRPSRRIASPAR